MLISPELLNLHSGVNWQKEFDLDKVKLAKLMLKPSTILMNALQASGVFFHMFSDRDAVEFFAGEEHRHNKLFADIHASEQSNRHYHLITDPNKNIAFARLQEDMGPSNLAYCLVVSLNDVKLGLKGFCVLFGKKVPSDVNVFSASIELFKQHIVDTLEIKKLHRLNRDRQELQELVADTNVHPIFVKDTQSRIMYANQAFINLYPEHMQQKVIGYTTVEEYPEQQRTAFLADDQEAFQKGVKTVVETIDFPNGEVRVLETTKRHFKTNAGSDFILGVSYDLTTQTDLIKKLRKKNQDLDEVARMLATDVRAPANAIVKFVTWLEEDLKGIESANIQDNLQQIKTRSTKVSKLLSALYAYCFAGRDTHSASSVSLTSCVSDILSGLKHQNKLDVQVDDVSLQVPQSAFKAVMNALIINAIEHNSNSQPSINVECSQDAKAYHLSVADNGSGIANERHEQIFTLFDTYSQFSEKEVKGVGLAIARKTIESYGGDISIDNQYSDGARFLVYWPKQ